MSSQYERPNLVDINPDEPLSEIDQAKRISEDTYTRCALSLIKQGIPFDIAFSLEWPEMIGWMVAFGESDPKNKFNWSTMKWIEK